ncbi:phosphoenolpyruvate carboxylase [Shigella flexneri]
MSEKIFAHGHKQKDGVSGLIERTYSALRSNVSMLGKVLGDTIKDALGRTILDRVETIRKLSKSSRAGNEANRQELLPRCRTCPTMSCCRRPCV